MSFKQLAFLIGIFFLVTPSHLADAPKKVTAGARTLIRWCDDGIDIGYKPFGCCGGG